VTVAVMFQLDTSDLTKTRAPRHFFTNRCHPTATLPLLPPIQLRYLYRT